MLALRSVRRPKPTCTGFVAACTVPNMPQSINNISIYIYVCLYVCVFVYFYVCMSVCLYVCMAVWLYGCMAVCLYVCMYVCMCMYVYVWHTYIHTYNIYIYIYIFMCIFMFIYHTLALSLKLRRPRQAMCLAGSSCLTVATAGLTSRMKDASFCALNVFGDAAFDDSALALAMCHVSRTALN